MAGRVTVPVEPDLPYRWGVQRTEERLNIARVVAEHLKLGQRDSFTRQIRAERETVEGKIPQRIGGRGVAGSNRK